MSMLSLWTRRAAPRLAVAAPLSRRTGAAVARFSTEAPAADAKPADAKPADTDAAAETTASVGRRQRVRIVKMADYAREGRRRLKLSQEFPEHDTLVAPGAQPGKRLRAAVMYRMFNTTLARALRPEQDLSVQNLHLARLASLRSLLKTYKTREAYKHKYEQRPVRVDFKPVRGTKAEKQFDPTKDAWIADYLKRMQFDLENTQSPWPVGKREDFLRTANKALHKHFNHQTLTAFAHGRPLPPEHRVRNAATRAAAQAAANAAAADL